MVRQAPGQHGLARPGRPHHQDIVAPGRRDDHGPFHLFLALDSRQSQCLQRSGPAVPPPAAVPGSKPTCPAKIPRLPADSGPRKPPDPLHHCGFPGIFFGDNQPVQSRLAAGQSHRQHAPGSLQASVQGNFTVQQIAVQGLLAALYPGRPAVPGQWAGQNRCLLCGRQPGPG